MFGGATRDHVFPKSRGYRLDDLNGWNKAIVCQPCNISKKNLDIVEWWWRLVRGGDRRAMIVLEFIRRIWFAGVLPQGSGDHFEALSRSLEPNASVEN
jgi:hypothetical protein